MINKNIIKVYESNKTKVFILNNNITINLILNNHLGQSYYYILNNKMDFSRDRMGIKIIKTSKI